MNRVEALDRYDFSVNLHNPLKRDGMPKSYEDRVLNDFIQRVKRKRKPTVLDLASGIGKSATAMDSAGIKTVRLDISFKSLRVNSGANVQAVFNNLPFRDKSFDAIHFKDGLVHVANRPNLFKQLFQILKPGGELLIITAEEGTLLPSFKIRYKSGSSRRKTFVTEEQYVEALKKLNRKPQTINREIFPPYYPLRRSWVISELSGSGFLVNFVSDWVPNTTEDDWYRRSETRHVYSSTRPIK